ncbi:hypothetical protein [Phycicoccus duodecadis]|uniref:Uncharacterized protein n=1 Tax=Phycicoccus duodecadis TaxID=173053 RepID=A0A2N3YK39_9MICO|nr:hypothetical protein [Phycicoccus duodecadis]PKW27227.1 hypothetical protein ATL31_2065 [Phycicoccus duodecadis]
MKVVVLSSARRTTPAYVASIRDQLGLDDVPDARMTWVALHHPRRPLPGLDTHVTGPAAVVRGRARLVPAGPAPLPGDDEPTAEDARTDDERDADASSTGPRPAGPPQPFVRRALHGVRWRARRAQRAAVQHPVAQRVAGSTKVRRVRSALTPGGAATVFAAGTLRSPAVNSLVRRADVVVALDARTYRAAWLLARRHRGPDVVVGTAAGKAAVTVRAAR